MRRQSAMGFSLTEASVVLGIVGILSAVGISTFDFGSAELVAVQEDLRGSIHQAFHLARAQGRNVIVTLGDPHMPDVLPVKLPPHVKWGKPASIPVPPGMDEPTVAGKTGEAHPKITVTPRHTATASAWFVNDGREAVCMRLSGHGHLQLLRWRRDTKKWKLV